MKRDPVNQIVNWFADAPPEVARVVLNICRAIVVRRTGQRPAKRPRTLAEAVHKPTAVGE